MSGLPDIGQPANAAFTASAPKEFGLISGPSFGLSRPIRCVMTAAGEQGKVMFTICPHRNLSSRMSNLNGFATPEAGNTASLTLHFRFALFTYCSYPGCRDAS